MIKKLNLKLIVFILFCLYSSMLSAQINTPSGAVVPFNSNPNYGTNGIMPTNLPSGGTYGKSQDAADAYNEWKSNYTETCSGGMIRVKFDEPNRTVSEGIGYGMQLAAYAADKALFDGLYAYWKNFASPQSSGKAGKLMNWRIDGCSGVSGTGSAADADIDAAWALLIAYTQWPASTSPYNYISEATNMMYSIKELELNSSGQLINGDGWGFGDQCRNPSYQAPAYYKTFSTINLAYTPAWNSGVNGAYNLLNANVDPTTGLASDWSNPSGVRNTCNPGGLGYAATDGYGYDACRNPWRMAQDVLWNNDASAKAICTKLAAFISTKGASGIGGPLYQTGGNYSGWSHNATFVSTFATAVMGSTSTYQTLMNSMYTETKNTKDVIKNSTLSGYFGNTLRCMSLFMMTGNMWKYGTTSVQEINIKQGANNVLTGKTYDFLNQQTVPPATSGKAVTFTIENLGFAQLNLTGTPNKVAVSGTDAGLFTVTQPTSSALALGATTNFTVTFTPTSTGTKTAVLSIASNDPDENPYIINLTGIGTANSTAPKMAVYDTVNVLTSGSAFPMGTFTVATVGSKMIKITNTGDATLSISSAAFTGTNPTLFSIQGAPTYPMSIPVGTTKYLSIGYTAPAAAASSSAILTLTTSDPNAPSFVLNVTAAAGACSANPANKMLNDYDGNINVKLAFAPKGTLTQSVPNPTAGGLNLSSTVASYYRRSANGDYDIIRYYNCGTVAGLTHASSTYVPFAISAANPTIQVLMYSPAVGIQVTMAPQKPDPATTKDWLPIISGYSSNVTVTTTKANQWELLTFDMSKSIAAGVTADFKALDFQIDPTRIYVNSITNNPTDSTNRRFLLDDIKYGINPCVNDLSGILQDFDAHTNTTLDYNVSFLTAPFANPVSGGLNTSANVGKYTKTITTGKYDDGFRYDGCSNKIDFSTKKYISMLVYSPVANMPIQISAKVPDDGATTDSNSDPDDAAASTQSTVFANKWHRIYFDLSAISAANLPKVFGIDIFFDPNDVSTITSGSFIYFDDIRLESSLPCVTGIPATGILNDFEDNRYMNPVFPLATTGTTTYFNTIKANPASGGINTSAIVGEFLRGTAATGTSLRLAACQNKLDLSPGNNIIEVKAYSPNAGAAVVMSLKAADGTTSISDVTDTIRTANTWVTLRFDQSKALNATNVAFIDLIVDGAAKFATTTAQRTYLFDDLKYASPSPEINVQALTPTGPTDILSTNAFNMGTAAIGDSTVMNFNIQNNGLTTLTLTGTGAASLVLSGANPADFVITTTQTFSNSISALGATGFTVTFKPTAGGARSAKLTIKSNDADEGTYVVYLTGTATVPVVSVLDGGTASSPVIINNGSAVINVGTSAVNVAATPAYTFSIKNTGVGPLTVQSVTASTGFVVSALSSTTPILTGAIVTFTVTGTPAAAGVNPGTLVVKTNDPVTPTYTVKISVTGSVPTLTVKDATAAVVASGNPVAISVGSAPVGTAAAPYTFTIANTGTGPLTGITVTGSTGFVVSLPTATTVAAGTTATFTVTATPAAAGTANTGTITIASNDPASPYKVNVSVTGTVPAISIKDKALVTVPSGNTTSPVLVGTAPVGTAAPAYTSFTISNTGLAPLNITSITSSAPTAFVPSAKPAAAIPAGGTATFTVTATPAAAGVGNTAVITIVSNDPTTPSYAVSVSATGTVPALTVKNGTTTVTSPTTAISVGSATVGSPAAAYTSFTINNTGLAPLTLTSIGVTGTIFKLTNLPTMPATIPAGGSATFTVTGTPAVVGSNTGTITIVTNDPTTSSFLLNVDVTGIAASTPAIQVKNGTAIVTDNSAAVLVGTAPVGTAAAPFTAFTINNNGTAALSLTSISVTSGGTIFALSNLPTFPASIAVGGSITFTVTATPAAAGTGNTGLITIASNDPATGSFKLNVTATGTVPQLQVFDGLTQLLVSPTAAISVGTAETGKTTTPAYTTLSIKNNGGAPLNISGITASAGFNVVATPAAPATVAAGGTVTLSVTATPTTVGTNTGTITIASNDLTKPSFVISVTATGTLAPQAMVVKNGTTTLTPNALPAINVGTAVKGSAAPANTSITITNTGGAALNIGSILGSTGYVVTTTPAAPTSIAANGTLTLNIVATPATVGSSNPGTITIASNDPTTGSFVINVTSTGTNAPTPALVVKDGTTTVTSGATAINVGTAAVGSPAAPYTTFTINNNGAAVLNLTSVSVTAGGTVFTLGGLPAFPATVAVGASQSFTVTATPSVVGVDANPGTITIKTDDPTTGTFTLNVTATGSSAPAPALQVLNNTTVVTNNNTPAISVGPTVLNTPGTPYTSFSIKNNGNAPLSVTGVTGTSVFAVSGITLPATIAAGTTASFTVTATPSATGVNNGTITITTNDVVAGPFTLNVTTTATSAPAPALQVLNGTADVPNNNTAISLGTSVKDTPGTPYTAFSVKNNGSAPLTLTSIEGTAVYIVSAISQTLPATLAVGASVTFTVTGTPTVVGTNSNPGAIVIKSNDATNGTFNLNVTMSASAVPVPPTVSIPGIVNGGSIDLGSAVTGGSTPSKIITISNPGTTPLIINSVDATGAVTVIAPSSFPMTIQPGSSGSITVVGNPTTEGVNPGSISIVSNDPTSPFVVNLPSNGTAKPVGAAIQILDAKGNILANDGDIIAIGANAENAATSPYYFTVKNIGTTALTINASAGTGFSALSTTTLPLVIQPGADAILKVAGTPTDASKPTVSYVNVISNDVTGNTSFMINVSVSVGTPTGLTKMLASSAIDLYPNPSNGNTNLEFNGSFDEVSVIVYKADGGHVYNENMASVSDLTKQLQLEELPAGVYFVEVNTAQGKIVKRMIKQ